MSRGAKKERTLAKELGALLGKTLLPDLRARARAPAVDAALRQRFAHEQAEERTAEPYDGWVNQLVEQVGAAWILSCVFVRTLEDRGLVPRRRLAGEGAADSEHYFYELAPSLNARDYLLTVFKELSRFPGTEALLGPKGNAAWRLAPSGPVAQALLDFFREQREDGTLRWTFAAPPDAGEGRSDGSNTRFLGDLYQDLSESVRERYALLQTPDFVERFILGLTLEPAIQEFGLEEVRVIDPTCGSGHFLLGAYDRLFAARQAAKPGLDRREHALAALAQVFGVDLNPYAVAIARFRLTLAFLEKAGLGRLADAPRLPDNLVVADSLLHGARGVTRELAEVAESKKEWGDALFTLEDPDRAIELLSRGYQVVVGNPPYITCKDAKLRDRYRRLYQSCHREYALAAPFTERFFQLGAPGGFVGLINANSFMKREFGKKLIEQVLPHLDLTHVIDTSGAFIPGHGTPTVILAGRNRAPAADSVHAVLGKRGEPSTPEDPERGCVWASINDHFASSSYDDEFITVASMARVSLAKHPWSLGGGGAAELKTAIEARAQRRLGEMVDVVGFGAVTREDELFELPRGAGPRWALPPEAVSAYGYGEAIRDWSFRHDCDLFFPYLPDGRTRGESQIGRFGECAWRYRTQLWERVGKGFKTKREAGGAYYEYSMFYPDRYFAPLRIAFAFVATHNHFVLDRGGKVFNRSAPIIKLPEGATEEDHLALLGYLNSSTACFWMKQVFHDKGSGTDSGKWQPDPAKIAFEFTGTGLEKLPVPDLSSSQRAALVRLARSASEVAAQREGALRAALPASSDLADGASVQAALDIAERMDEALLEQLIGIQEEIDWLVCTAFKLADEAAPLEPERTPLGARPFEIVAAQAGLVIGTDGQKLRAAVPQEWSPEKRERWAARIATLGQNAQCSLIEQPDYKRRFCITPKDMSGRVITFRDRAEAHVREVLLGRVEEVLRGLGPTPVTVPLLVRRCLADPYVAALASIVGAGASDPADTLAKLVAEEAVPALPAHRFTPAGAENHAAWQRTWDLQRREDAGEEVGEIPVPPKYDQKDYRDPVYWRLRGKLDVPKERFISYPGAERDDDKSPLIGWAGWDQLQRAQALAALYQERKNQDGWEKERLQPLLAGLLELVPWLKQWHDAPSDDPAKDRAGEAFAAFVDGEARALGFTLDDLRAWRPPERKPKAPRKTKPKKAKEAAE